MLKLLVVDCDGTLWHGVAGEQPDPVIREDVVAKVKEFQDAGVLVAVCTRNAQEDVEPLLRHLDLHSTLIDALYSALSKVSYVRYLSDKLRLDLDDIYVLDDDPVERERLRGVCSILDPGLAFWLGTYPHAPKYDRLQRTRTAMEVWDGIDRDGPEFLESIEQTVRIEEARDRKSDRERIDELYHRTHKLRTTTNVRSGETWAIRMSSTLEPEEIVGAASVASVFLTTFVMSCRMDGRGVAEQALRQLKREHTGLVAIYHPSKQNQRMRGILARAGVPCLSG